MKSIYGLTFLVLLTVLLQFVFICMKHLAGLLKVLQRMFCFILWRVRAGTGSGYATGQNGCHDTKSFVHRKPLLDTHQSPVPLSSRRIRERRDKHTQPPLFISRTELNPTQSHEPLRPTPLGRYNIFAILLETAFTNRLLGALKGKLYTPVDEVGP